VQAGDGVLVRELCARYLRPWCAVARQRLGARGDAIGELADRFEGDLGRAEAAGCEAENAAPICSAAR
jgi:hypothetical protein